MNAAGDDKNANRISIVSTSSAESALSEEVEKKSTNAEVGSSIFYVMWD